MTSKGAGNGTQLRPAGVAADYVHPPRTRQACFLEKIRPFYRENRAPNAAAANPAAALFLEKTDGFRKKF
jgi:hypothetical protein